MNQLQSKPIIILYDETVKHSIFTGKVLRAKRGWEYGSESEN